jgi:hypothetical protein
MDPQTQNNNDYAVQDPASTTQNGPVTGNTDPATQTVQPSEVQPDLNGGAPADNSLPQDNDNKEPASEESTPAEGDNNPTQP